MNLRIEKVSSPLSKVFRNSFVYPICNPTSFSDHLTLLHLKSLVTSAISNISKAKKNVLPKIRQAMKPIITIIDDSQMIVHFLKHFLSNKYELKTYHKGSEAISDILCEKYQPACVITDYHMPNDLGGTDILDQLKSMRPDVPVMVLSGSTEMNERINCIDRGAFDFIEKPFNPLELEARINRTINFFKAQSKELQYAV